MPHSPAASFIDDDEFVTTLPAPVRALESVPEPEVGSAPATGESVPRDCVTVAFDASRTCVVRLCGSLGREGIARVDVVLDAVALMSRPIVVDLSAAWTRDRRLWRVLTDLVARRRDAGRTVVLEGVHPGVVPDLEVASLPETFLVFRAVCARTG